MLSRTIRKRQTRPRAALRLEEMESRALLSSVRTLPLLETVYSTNWSGYAAETNLNSPASNAVTMVSGSWTVPTVKGKTNAYSSVWVGIDGYSSSTVEQLGTEQDTTRSGATRYYAWWEMYPNGSVLISGMTISPGDSMSASVTYSSGTFTLQMTDNTTGQSFSTNRALASAQRSSAEWIVEAPSSGTILPLANFGTVHFSAAQATISGTTGAVDNGSWQNTSIDMVSKSGTVIDQTSGLTDGGNPVTSGFGVTYSGSGGGGGHGHGHGPIETAEFVVPAQAGFQPSVPDVTTGLTAEPPAASSAGQDPAVSGPAVDAYFAQSPEHGPTSELKTSENGWSYLTEEALRSEGLGPSEFSQML